MTHQSTIFSPVEFLNVDHSQLAGTQTANSLGFPKRLGGAGTHYTSYLVDSSHALLVFHVFRNPYPTKTNEHERLRKISSLSYEAHIWPQTGLENGHPFLDSTPLQNAEEQYCYYSRPYAPLLLSTSLKFPYLILLFLSILFTGLEGVNHAQRSFGLHYLFSKLYRIYIHTILCMEISHSIISLSIATFHPVSWILA